jgi:hypothetical protein
MLWLTYFPDASTVGGGLPQPALIPVGPVAPDIELLASAPGLTALPLAPAPPLPALEPVEAAPLAVVPFAPLELVAPAVLVVPLELVAPAALVVPLVFAVAAAPELEPLLGVEPLAPEDAPLVSAAPPALAVPGDVLLEQAAATNMAAQAARG